MHQLTEPLQKDAGTEAAPRKIRERFIGRGLIRGIHRLRKRIASQEVGRPEEEVGRDSVARGGCQSDLQVLCLWERGLAVTGCCYSRMRTRLRSFSGESENRIGPEGIVRVVCRFWVFHSLLFFICITISYLLFYLLFFYLQEVDCDL
jgi:hypothetical protein